ncbi:MAG: peptidase C45 acyl-coenzyme A:6-aminopenicillanic acid acyl-transferase [Fuerstiella sp.]|nr:peptidase C45 acyl-coenzyme A:6-aminopenicillanic acid acyl-transferase [Fuerstiella sp.]MCP4509412.1 peptidase C45 acyl-coenzyme A:6-aminopenicillanic acid acyl-transferase [Fuerstiella sp.]
MSRLILASALVVGLTQPCVHASDSQQIRSLSKGLAPFLNALSGSAARFRLTGKIQVDIDDEPQSINIRIALFDDDSFDLVLTHADYAVEIRRRADSTTMILPLHQMAFVGTGEVTHDFSLAPKGIVSRLVSPQSVAAPFVLLPGRQAVGALVAFGNSLLQVEQDRDSGEWLLTDDSPLRFPQPGSLLVSHDQTQVELSVTEDVPEQSNELSGVQIVEIPRPELEKTLLRGVRRATEILFPAPALKNPPQHPRRTEHGELRWVGDHRVVLLDGTPEQIGTAHGQLLKAEAVRCIESVLYTFGTVYVIKTGHWFRHALEDAYAQLAPHIPERHKRETAALASSLGMSDSTLQILNVFPEMFHCSGFAVFNTATKDGKLYHGRVLDYMTTIGLQDAATTFIVKPDGYIPFANVGYASFIGSVSGMNNKAVSLGEMGGKGQGNWDGVPMATLMRRALEECTTLDEVMQLWTESPRTCEYYYVFADGKTNTAVGVAALPESVEFIRPGQSHARLGEGIPDSIVLSAGSRLETLRGRVSDKHGQIDAEIGKWLMSRPVAMQSNLHNVLFIPADGVLHVANASHTRPAAEEPYVELNLSELLESMTPARLQTTQR